MPLLPFAQFGPDRSAFDATFCDRIENVLPKEGGWGPFPSFTPFSQPLPGEDPMGSMLVYVANGAYRLFVGTLTRLYMFDITTLGWLDKTRLAPSTITNGTFDLDANWTKGTNWTIASGVATATAANTALGQAQTFLTGTAYQVTFTVSGYTAGTLTPMLQGGTVVAGTAVNGNGTYTQTLVAATGNNVLAFVATSATLNLDNVSLQSAANYNGAQGVRWSMAQYGDWLIATNGQDNPQYIDCLTVTRFADLPNAPRAYNVSAVGDFVMMSHLTSNQRMVQWSGLNQPTFWTPRERSSDYQPFPDGGEIMGTASGPDGLVIFSAESIREGTLALETPLVFNFKTSVPNHGCLAPRSIVSTGNGIFYYSDDGFYKYSKPPTPIGNERVDGWFHDNIQNSDIYDMYGGEDPSRKIVYWAFRSTENQTVGTYDKVLLYHYGIDRWSVLNPGIILTGLIDATTPGYTLDGLDALGLGLDSLPYSLDSRAWSGSSPLIAAFDQSRRLGYFAGPPMQAVLQTGDNQLTEDGRSMVTGFRPLVDAQNLIGRTATKETPGDELRWRDPIGDNRIGTIPQITSGLFHRFEVTIPSQAWSEIHGIFPVDAQPDGDQ